MTEIAQITLVLPYFNEADYIGATLASLGAQSDHRFRLIAVDNGSTDDSAQIARAACAAMPHIQVEFREEPVPGKINALRSGLSGIATPFVGTIDADTLYPANYIANCLQIFSSNPDASCALAFGITQQQVTMAWHLKHRLNAAIFPKKCHTGGFGQCFRRDFLEAVGGFDQSRWPYVLEDHEIVHRIGYLGPIACQADFFCHPSERRDDRTACSWTIPERILYKLTPGFAMDWFFYSFLACRFERRGLNNLRLREKSWERADD